MARCHPSRNPRSPTDDLAPLRSRNDRQGLHARSGRPAHAVECTDAPGADQDVVCRPGWDRLTGYLGSSPDRLTPRLRPLSCRGVGVQLGTGHRHSIHALSCSLGFGVCRGRHEPKPNGLTTCRRSSIYLEWIDGSPGAFRLPCDAHRSTQTLSLCDRCRCLGSRGVGARGSGVQRLSMGAGRTVRGADSHGVGC
jgi:hypothetical protein